MAFDPNSSLDQAAGIAGPMILQAAQSLPGLTTAAAALCYLLGVVFMVMGINSLREANEHGQRGQGSWKSGFVTMLVGTVLINIPEAVTTILTTVYQSTLMNGDSPLAYSGGSLDGNSKLVMGAIVKFIQFVGFLAFVRGWLILKAVGDGGGQDASMGKAITHIFGGTMAINIVATTNIISDTFGIGFTI